MMLILLVAGLALAAPEQFVLGYCATDTLGSLDGRWVRLGDVQLPPPNKSFEVLVPDVNGCDKVGVSMTCCDDEAPSMAKLRDLNAASVVRTGPARVPAIVSTIVFCAGATSQLDGRHPTPAWLAA